VSLPQPNDYTARDYDTLKARLRSLWLSVFPTYPVDANGNPGNILRELFAHVGDTFHYYLDAMARETRWGSARTRKAMISLGKVYGFELQGASAATCDVTLSRSALAPGETLSIAAGTVVKTSAVNSPVRGETQAALDLSDGVASSGDVAWEHSETRSETFAANGQPNQELYLGYAPYLDGSIGITTAAGTWSEVDNHLSSDPTDLHFTIRVDQNDHAWARCGDGSLGALWDGSIAVAYKTGGGVSGNVDAGALVEIEGTFVGSLGTAVTLTATNASGASGGEARETVNAARDRARSYITALSRTVSRSDYETRALQVSGVGRALMLTSDDTTDIDENRGRLYIVPTNGGTASSALLAAVMNEIDVNYPPTITFQYDVLTAVYQTVDVEVRGALAQGYTWATAQTLVDQALSELFEPIVSRTRTVEGVQLTLGEANPYVDFGYNYKDEDGDPAGELAWSDVYNIVRDLACFRKLAPGDDGLKLNSQSDDVLLSLHRFPALGSVTLRDETGAAVS